MNTTNRTLDKLMTEYGISSDYGLAKLLKVTPGSVSNWRKEKSQMADGPAIYAARLLKEDADELLALLQAERAPDDETKKVWRHIASRLRRTAAVIAMAITSFLGISHAPPARAASVDSPTMYIMVNMNNTFLRSAVEPVEPTKFR